MVADRKTAAQALALNKPCKQEGWPPDIQLLGAVRVSYSGPLSSEGAVIMQSNSLTMRLDR